MNQAGIDLVKKYEGCRLQAYKCQAGVWTIGIGHTQGVKQGDVITLNKAIELFQEDIKYFEAKVKELVKVALNENELAAVVSLTFNIGVNAFKGSTLLKRINARSDEQSIRNAFIMWVYVGKIKSTGLTRRRQAEANLYFTRPF